MTGDSTLPSDSTNVFDLFRLDGQTALVSGGAGWLGAAPAAALAEAGARVIIGSRRQQRADHAAANLPEHARLRHLGVAFDQTNADSMQEAWSRMLARVGQVDILVNNAVQSCGHDWSEVDFEEFFRHQANSAGCFLLSRLFRDHRVDASAARPGGSIINIGSMYALVASYPSAYAGVGPANPVAYQVMKAGMLQMTRHLAVYWAKDGIRVNCLSPGPFPNPATAPEPLITNLCQHSPMGRMGRPVELKGAVLLLASSAGSYITGQNLVVDGGWTAW